MIVSLVLQRKRNKVQELADLVEAERQLLRQMSSTTLHRVDDHLRGDWAVVGSFGAGLAMGWLGIRALRPLRKIPFFALAKQMRSYMGVGF